MKKMIVAVLALCLAASAFAGIGIEWNTTGVGIFLQGSSGTDMTAFDELALSKTDVFWQLIFSSDNVKDEIDINNADGGYLAENAEDQVLADRTISKDTGSSWDDIVSASDGTEWMACGLNVGGDKIVFSDENWTTAGYVYQRVFGGLPGEGVWYYETDLVRVDTGWDKMKTPQGVYIDSADKGAVFDTQIPGGGPTDVPEPATMSLLGLGALAMVIRRKLRK